ncbi:MAG TPA: hypothetical protein PKK74_02670 [Candidatus Methanoculleus thermohydrogenotrophicum]|jgi:hypothetical protein|nr:hypothetical protein [Candidatus Methanoculleus thermohydrogenotrophicum]NLM82894.1 hypothetical protein [Candidatus Methanoculleus thermohydrogenotrophicum]HOB17587.1 hypothetical protein [Candidatus Methanoculleus thermohydrogenotrophicum]HPZ37743.1 hypothetical protein [Candidatus Methanoculleus thermohydrogenotrophicum]HQC90846.1 hypothetical protein [Candidatus Methanoculleus thermohydrogenotrophicum]
MDPIIEEGYTRLLETIEDLQAKKEEIATELREGAGALVARMAADTAPIINRIGLEMLWRAKREASGELYEQVFYEKKMIVLGKSDPLPYRPDDPSKPVDTQLCVLSEDGNFYEVMYTTTEIRVDSYASPLTPEEAFDIYGYDLVFMLYRAMYEYAEQEEELTAALARALEYIAL